MSSGIERVHAYEVASSGSYGALVLVVRPRASAAMSAVRSLVAGGGSTARICSSRCEGSSSIGRCGSRCVRCGFSGATLAAVTVVVAIRGDAGGLGGYAAAVALALRALLTARGHRLITMIGVAACAGQPIAVAATAWEVTHRISQTQVEKLYMLGVNPSVGVAINLVFSLCASVLAAWAFRRAGDRRDFIPECHRRADYLHATVTVAWRRQSRPKLTRHSE